MPRKIEISYKTIVFTAVFGLFLWLLFSIREILLQFFVALLLMTILNPLVSRLSKFRIPRLASVVVVYLIFFTVIGFLIASIAPNLIEQTTNLATNLPKSLANINFLSSYTEPVLKEIVTRLGDLPGQLINITISIFANIMQVIAVLIFTFYLLLIREKLDEQLSQIFGEDLKKKVGKIIDQLELKLGGWARGELILMFVIGLANYIVFMILKLPFALPLAILAGLLEIVPTLGPIIAGVPAVIIGLTISPLTALIVAISAFLIQQLENYVLVPKIMSDSVGVSPLLVLFSLTVGYTLAGVVGAIISVPVLITVQVLVKEYLKSR